MTNAAKARARFQARCGLVSIAGSLSGFVGLACLMNGETGLIACAAFVGGALASVMGALVGSAAR